MRLRQVLVGGLGLPTQWTLPMLLSPSVAPRCQRAGVVVGFQPTSTTETKPLPNQEKLYQRVVAVGTLNDRRPSSIKRQQRRGDRGSEGRPSSSTSQLPSRNGLRQELTTLSADLREQLAHHAYLRSAAGRVVSRREEQLQGIRSAVQAAAMRLSPKHAAAATLGQLVALLKVCTVASASGATHIARLCLTELATRRVPRMTADESMRLLTTLLSFEDSLPASDRQAAIQRTLDHLLAVEDDSLQRVSLRNAVRLLQQLQTSSSVGRAHGYEILRRLVQILPSHKHELKPGDVAVVCQAVCHFRFADKAAVDFFVEAVDVCRRNMHQLSAKQAAFILDAFAAVGYIHTGLFLELGQHAGERGDRLTAADVSRILNAFERTQIDYTALRAALEANIRLRPLFEPSRRRTQS